MGSGVNAWEQIAHRLFMPSDRRDNPDAFWLGGDELSGRHTALTAEDQRWVPSELRGLFEELDRTIRESVKHFYEASEDDVRTFAFALEVRRRDAAIQRLQAEIISCVLAWDRGYLRSLCDPELAW